MMLSATHVVVSLIISCRPLKKGNVCCVHRATKGKSLYPSVLLLAFPEPGQANLGGHEQEDYQLKARDEDIAPTAQRSGERPAGVRIQRSGEQHSAFLSFAGSLIGGIGRFPEVVVGIEMRIPHLQAWLPAWTFPIPKLPRYESDQSPYDLYYSQLTPALSSKARP